MWDGLTILYEELIPSMPYTLSIHFTCPEVWTWGMEASDHGTSEMEVWDHEVWAHETWEMEVWAHETWEMKVWYGKTCEENLWEMDVWEL